MSLVICRTRSFDGEPSARVQLFLPAWHFLTKYLHECKTIKVKRVVVLVVLGCKEGINLVFPGWITLRQMLVAA